MVDGVRRVSDRCDRMDIEGIADRSVGICTRRKT